VFPRVACANSASNGSAGGAGGSSSASTAEETIDTKSPEYQVTSSDLTAFKELYKTKTQSWRQRKKMLKVLQEGAEYFLSIEQKLISGAVLTPKEQAAYESNSGADAEKIVWLQGEVKKMVDEGKLTATEKEELIASLETNLKSVQDEIAAANAEGKPKKVEKLEEKKQGILSRKAVVQKIDPIQHRSKHSEDIIKLRTRLIPLQALEDKGRSMSLTLADLKTLEEKSDIEAAIAHAESLSRGWFETEEDFRTKCLLDEKEAKAKYNAKVKSQAGKKPSGSLGSKTGTVGRTGGGSSSYSASSASSWSTVAVKKSSGGSTAAAPKKAASGFAAAFGDDDSDSD
jgi:hypothetical protein